MESIGRLHEGHTHEVAIALFHERDAHDGVTPELAGLVAAGFSVVLLETRHVKAALSAMAVKTDRKDARGIAQLLRMG